MFDIADGLLFVALIYLIAAIWLESERAQWSYFILAGLFISARIIEQLST